MGAMSGHAMPMPCHAMLCHAKVHRDLKPLNLLLTKYLEVHRHGTMPCTQCRTCRRLQEHQTLHISSCCMCPVVILVILDIPRYSTWDLISMKWSARWHYVCTMSALCPWLCVTVCVCSSEVKVADLGIARVLARAGPESGDCGQKGMTGGIGTWRYMAPEVVRHQKYTEKASDTNEHLGLETPLILRCVNCVTFWLLSLETCCITNFCEFGGMGLLKADGDVAVSPYWMWNHALLCPPAMTCYDRLTRTEAI